MVDITSDGLIYYDSEGRPISYFSASTNVNVVWDKENSIIKERGDNMERNKVLDLYVDRKREEIRKIYKDIVEKEYNELPEIKEYNEIVNEFNAKIDELVERSNSSENKIFCRSGYSTNHYVYDINYDLRDEIEKKHNDDFRKEMDALDYMANEINALLSMSDDKDYQIEVLKNYGILDKKTGKLTI